MDDVDGEQQRRSKGDRADPKKKYMEVLQGIADRTVSEVLVELDDLHEVRESTSVLML